jgi:hypothetical protein
MLFRGQDTRGPAAVKTTEIRELGFRSWVEGAVNQPRSNARAVVHKLRNFVLFRWPAPTDTGEVAGHRLGTAISRQSRANGDCDGTVVRVAIVWRPELLEATSRRM